MSAKPQFDHKNWRSGGRTAQHPAAAYTVTKARTLRNLVFRANLPIAVARFHTEGLRSHNPRMGANAGRGRPRGADSQAMDLQR